ncbi:hypothetical protein EVAR_24831_1 [Eumeta japonica]|uniref:Uncharacterized protein n=1 Tax=Eumeta variegata TaxID=151549 RepID=A0A4C1W069_EUMVA|nr:hypothetical protein EVAR_24831_1 [Eumeta japonica]
MHQEETCTVYGKSAPIRYLLFKGGRVNPNVGDRASKTIPAPTGLWKPLHWHINNAPLALCHESSTSIALSFDNKDHALLLRQLDLCQMIKKIGQMCRHLMLCPRETVQGVAERVKANIKGFDVCRLTLMIAATRLARSLDSQKQCDRSTAKTYLNTLLNFAYIILEEMIYVYVTTIACLSSCVSFTLDAEVPVSWITRLRLGVTYEKGVTLGNVTMSHRTRERPAECLASLSHSTMIGLPRAQH